ncbi:MAG: DUF3450 family protein [Opitutales bacterium]
MKQIVHGMALAALVGVPVAHADSVEAVKETQQLLSKWVEIESELSREQADWLLEEQIIADRIALLKTEIASLEERIEQSQEEASAAEQQRTELVETRDALRAASNTLGEGVGDLETAVKTLYATFPEPLQQELSKLRAGIPDDPGATNRSISLRLQNVAGILSNADKFNNAINLVTEVKEVGDGRTAEVDTLYYGLAGAWFVDRTAAYAGIGRPGGADGWNWTQANDAGPEIRKAVRTYQNAEEPDFVTLPVEIQ